ncbi:hypothetical protein DFA_09390 [Cavenderia fasciculata]|uniref:Transmembrane protein n=1 Tax=Cavenderia fasciculata TaxID=261658 RepID=F4Q7H7_CACFS|nr:uncharacterized protein DFA_09390 [Cavenderia fasciculata]EGG16359.1 hypothetical protein DFA_09390 [Cavenderia fasciculata]|eukprot:XP_004354743.1 hypothetical protein DFA_09390 [Cavenderia fasciculata]
MACYYCRCCWCWCFGQKWWMAEQHHLHIVYLSLSNSLLALLLIVCYAARLTDQTDKERERPTDRPTDRRFSSPPFKCVCTARLAPARNIIVTVCYTTVTTAAATSAATAIYVKLVSKKSGSRQNP